MRHHRLRPVSRILPRIASAGLVLGLSIVAWSVPVVAQEAGPGTPVPAALADACAAITASHDATPAATDAGATQPGFDEVAFDQLAIDTLASHHQAVIALTGIALAGSTQPEIAQLAEATRLVHEDETTQLDGWRTDWFDAASPMPIEYQSALLDEALAATGISPGSGEAPVLDPLRGAGHLCEVSGTVPLDLAVIDLLTAELQSGVALGIYVTSSAEHEELAEFGQTIVDRGTATIGQLAIWRDAWFGPTAAPVVAPADHSHEAPPA